MKNKVVLSILALAFSTHVSHSMSLRRVKIAKVFAATKRAPYSVAQRRLLQERLKQLDQNVATEKAFIEDHTKNMVWGSWSQYTGMTRGHQIAQALNRKQELEKLAFVLKMKLAKK